jgi:hypothetical protein
MTSVEQRAADRPPPVLRRRFRRRRRPLLVAVVVVAVLGGAVALAISSRPGGLPDVAATKPPPSCNVAMPSGRLRLDLVQAANAATIAAVGKRLGLVDHAVTIALVASLQETKLRNLPYGDLDSVGLFQQRPSQGWGAPAQLLQPIYAATAFYNALVRVSGWETMPVGDAAQKVQRSAAPDAYGPWENQGRALAQALTGETAASFTCSFDLPVPAPASAGAATPPSLEHAVAGELGAPALGVSLTENRGWTVASWLVAHAYDYRISAVTFLGQRWTAASGTWQPDGAVVDQVQVDLG